MDREANEGTQYCWAHFMPMEDPGRGPVLVLGMPFLRKFYTVFDFGNQAIGFALARQPPRDDGASAEPAQDLVVNGSFVPQPAAQLAEAPPPQQETTHKSSEGLEGNSSLGHGQGTMPLLACRGACYSPRAPPNAADSETAKHAS